MSINNDDELNIHLEEKAELSGLSKFVKKMFTLKNPDNMLKQAQDAGLKKTLNAFDLIILGVGAIIGSGIFTVVGIAAAGSQEAAGAGSGLVFSVLLASLACIFSALCYSEFASMIPVAGSAYLYTYATMGEFMAWMIGWILILEYIVAYIAVVSAWSGYFMHFLKGFSNFLPDFIVNPPAYLIHDYTTAVREITSKGLNPDDVIPHIFGIPISLDLPAIIITLFIIAILIKGIKESTKMTGALVIVKLGVIALFIITGLFYVKPENWSANWVTPFVPTGISGILMGAFIMFFAYIGFDAIATAAEETKNPQKNLPIGIIGSLLVCTITYVLVALVLTGVAPIDKIDITAPIASAMSMVGQNWVAGLISIGALTGITSVLLVMMLAGTRILYAMSRDNFLPKILQKVHPKYKTPHILTIFVGIICILGTLSLNISVAAELCNFGTFTSFIIVCVAVIILRKIDPERHRPFKVPFSPYLPAMGIICCGGLMLYSTKFLKTSTTLFPIWIVMGIVLYFIYSYPQKRKLEGESEKDV
ncbi:MAG: amino acid permease [Candidatus Gastranaerophilales bacterium]|nr:amino acid permease [Candidatus Gastranaerophilales bacterium]